MTARGQQLRLFDPQPPPAKRIRRTRRQRPSRQDWRRAWQQPGQEQEGGGHAQPTR